MSETCPVQTWDNFNRYTCGRPVKRDGMCGIHAAAKDKKARNKAARREAEDMKRYESVALAERLERHGIEARVGLAGDLIAPAWSVVADALDARYPEVRA